MTALSPSVFSVGPGEVRAYLSDLAELRKGSEIFNKKGILRPSRFQNKLFGEVAGSSGELYKVSLVFTDIPRSIKANCTCEAAKTRPICKHGAALLIGWAQAPDSFVAGDSAPSLGSVKVKEGKTTTNELMKNGVEQVITLVKELSAVGVAAVAQDRADQILKLGESLREHRLRRLSSQCIELGTMLSSFCQGKAPLDAPHYADLMTGMLITARFLEKGLKENIPLEKKYEEELVGKQWRPSELSALSGLSLIEIAYIVRETSDGFLVRESRLLDVNTGKAYCERQSVPLEKQRQAEPQKSRAATLLSGVSAKVYPGFPPDRIAIDRIDEESPLGPEAIWALVEHALPDVGSALALLKEYRKDRFAPDWLPVSVRVDTLFARGSRIEAVDTLGHALHLPDDPVIEEKLSNALRDCKLCALLGDVGIDAALPILKPLAAVVLGAFGPELWTLADPGFQRRVRKDARPVQGAREKTLWTEVARKAGVPEITIVLAELREELACGLVAGLSGLGSASMRSIAARLRDMKASEGLAEIADRIETQEDSYERLKDFIKLQKGLGLYVASFAGATHVDRAALSCVPTFESVFVWSPEKTLPPDEVKKRRLSGQLNRYEAAVHSARFYEDLPSKVNLSQLLSIWGDGSAGVYVALAFAKKGEQAVSAAHRVLTEKSGRVAKMTAVRVLSASKEPKAEAALHSVVESESDVAIAAMARDALDILDLKRGHEEAVKKRRMERDRRLGSLVKMLLTAPQKKNRSDAAQMLSELGHRGALSALRRAYSADITPDVREEAAYALSHLGDTEMVEPWLSLLRGRNENENPEEVRVAIKALGKLGDVRSLPELLQVYADGYAMEEVGSALLLFGDAVLLPLLEAIEKKPELLRRKATRTIFEHMDADRLALHLVERLKNSIELHLKEGGDEAALVERSNLYLKLSDSQSKSRRVVAKAVAELLRPFEQAQALVKMAERASGIRN